MLNEQTLTYTKVEKQPKGLSLLFLTELWERFGFYTVQTILILYMTKGLLMNDYQANLLYATFASFVYLTPIMGGYLADRYLGFQRSIMIGGVLFIIAYVICASSNKDIFFLGLSLLIIANGFFKPNVSAIVGDLYHKNDDRRDGGFTIFYMGINIGALIPPLITGALVAHYGWHSGFYLAAIGMLFGQLCFMSGRKSLQGAGLSPKTSTTVSSFRLYFLMSLGILLILIFLQAAFHNPQITEYMMEIAGIALIFILSWFLLKEPIIERKRLLACIILIVISLGFWSLYNQSFTSLMLFADRNMEQHFFGFKFDAQSTQFFNPFFIITLSPILSRLWINMGQSGINPSTQLKFALGAVFMCLGFFIMAFAVRYFGSTGVISSSWLCWSYLLQTIAELLISPVGLAMITVLSPKHLTGLMMGVWFFSQAASFTIGGALANIAAVPKNEDLLHSLQIYGHAFFIYGVIALILVILSIVVLPILNRLLKD